MKLIRLHLASDNEEIFLNVNRIIYFHKLLQGKYAGYTLISPGKNNNIVVSESVEEICKLLGIG